ncbi:hypothetical protein OH76DRAFT_171361 [Lentinus brumalis]|uniref:F-box domain-containing protein n=1 Tax=Lentinus brumalis TaxID=2498619 RepID=A0A371DJA6_9APHY|nr:hypothetical protein OH76DRAFT_171361 [Polyporus brumalis]
MLPKSLRLTTLLSVLLPPRPGSRHAAPPDTDRLTSPLLEDLNLDVFRLIALQLDIRTLENLASCSHRLRDLSAPILFYYCRVNSMYGCTFPPCTIEPFVRHLVHYGSFDEPDYIDHFPRLLDRFPALKSVKIDSSECGVPWPFLKACFARPHITSITIGEDADFLEVSPFPEDQLATTSIRIAEFQYVTPPFREYRHGELRRDFDLEDALPNESRSLSAILLRMNETVERLSLPMETAPLQAMAEVSWPQLRELTLQGNYVDTAHTLLVPKFLRGVPNLRKLSILASRPSDVPRAPTLGCGESGATSAASYSVLSPHAALAELRSLTIADPDPKDDIFSTHFPHLTHLSLRDWRRYYSRNGYRRRHQPPTQQFLTATESLSILKRMCAPSLRSLELVYIADGAEDELLAYICGSFLELSQLELHRYRQDRKALVPHTRIARLLLAAKSLQVVRLNLDFQDDHGAYCPVPTVRDQWYPVFKARGWELVNILEACPRLEYLGLLYHGIPAPLWVEFHPSRCAEPRYVEECTRLSTDFEPYSNVWIQLLG